MLLIIESSYTRPNQISMAAVTGTRLAEVDRGELAEIASWSDDRCSICQDIVINQYDSSLDQHLNTIVSQVSEFKDEASCASLIPFIIHMLC